jgi:hypothetical protein
MTAPGDIPIRTRRGSADALLPVPLQPGPPVELEAYERAPTLMGAMSPGTHGQVQVWAPDRKKLRIAIAGFGLATVIVLSLVLPHSNTPGPFSYVAWSTAAACFTCIGALRRPGYVTTDEVGIGITTRKGSLALKWEEISSLRLVVNGGVRWSIIELKAPGKIRLNTVGYPARMREDLLELIIARTGLVRSSKRDWRWAREPQIELPTAPGPLGRV